MNLKYYLLDNTLTPDPTDMRAVSKWEQTITHEQLVSMIAEYRNVGVSKSQIMSVLEEYLEVMLLFLKTGSRVQTPLLTISPTVAGVFINEEDTFDRERHSVNLNVQLSDALQAAEAFITPQKIEADKTAPVITQVYDVASDSKNTALTVGQPVKILGKQLRIDSADPQQGVFFVHANNGKETRGEVYSDNMPKKLTVTVPAKLSPGSYTIKVRTVINNKLFTAELEGTLAAN